MASQDSAHDLLNLPISNLRQYVELFPNEGLSKVITGYLSSGISRHPLRDKPKDAPDLSEGGVALDNNDPISQEDCLVLMTVRFILPCKGSESLHTDMITGRHTRNKAVGTCTLLIGRLLPVPGRV